VNTVGRAPWPRKRFGQHFLTDAGVLQRIESALQLAGGDRLLEIGPGPGALTEQLYGLPGRYLAIEIDRDLCPPLARRFPGLELINDDVLRVDLETLLEDGDWRVLGNLPYNISTPLLLRLLTVAERIRDMLFMVQLEVAERLTAVPGTKSWGRLSVMVQYHCAAEALFEVPPEAFAPPPRVRSAVIRLRPRPFEPALVPGADLAAVLRVAFSQRRKRLANALKSLPIDWHRVDVDTEARPDHLAVADYVALANALALQQQDDA